MILANHGPWAKSICLSKVLLENSHTHSRVPRAWLLFTVKAELSSATVPMGHKVQNSYYKKDLPTCGLNTPIKRPRLSEYVWKVD